MTLVVPFDGSELAATALVRATTSIAIRLRREAEEESTSMVFIGSENAGHLVSAVGSVGSTVATDEAYDVVIVRHRRPATLAERESASA